MANRRKKAKTQEQLIKVVLMGCGMLSIFTTIGIIGVLLFETIAFFKTVSILDFLTDTQWTPLFVNKHFGILPLLSGTILTSTIAMGVAAPLGLLTAIFLSEYAPGRLRRALIRHAYHRPRSRRMRRSSW